MYTDEGTQQHLVETVLHTVGFYLPPPTTACTRRCVEVSSLQAAPAGHGEDEPLDAPRYTHPPPEALSASGGEEEQAHHFSALSPGRPGHGASHGEPHLRHPSTYPAAQLESVQAT